MLNHLLNILTFKVGYCLRRESWIADLLSQVFCPVSTASFFAECIAVMVSNFVCLRPQNEQIFTLLSSQNRTYVLSSSASARLLVAWMMCMIENWMFRTADFQVSTINLLIFASFLSKMNIFRCAFMCKLRAAQFCMTICPFSLCMYICNILGNGHPRIVHSFSLPMPVSFKVALIFLGY